MMKTGVIARVKNCAPSRTRSGPEAPPVSQSTAAFIALVIAKVITVSVPIAPRVAVPSDRRYRGPQEWAFDLSDPWGDEKRARTRGKRKASHRVCGRGYSCYRVRRGDTLWKISKRRYGTGRKYRRIYKANRKRIRNPNRIYTKQVICLKK